MNEVLHPIGREQLGRIRRRRSRQHDRQVRHLGLLDDVLERNARGEVIHQAEVHLAFEDLLQTRTAKVGVEQQHRLAHLREHGGEVDGGRRLAFAGEGRRDHDDLRRVR